MGNANAGGSGKNFGKQSGANMPLPPRLIKMASDNKVKAGKKKKGGK